MADKWISISPTSGGSTGQTTETTVKATAVAYSGREARSASIKATSASGGTASSTVTQTGHAAYVTLLSGEDAKTVLAYDSANGDYHVVTTVQGVSNARFISLASTATVISGVTATLTVDGAVVTGWDGINTTEVTGDPGAAGEYAFTVTFSVPENQSESARTHKVALATQDATSATITITQQAGTKWWGGPFITSISKTLTDIPASGGKAGDHLSIASVSYEQDTGWNGRWTTTVSGTLNAGTVEFVNAVLYLNMSGNDITDTWADITAASLGTTVTPRQDIVEEMSLSLVLNGKRGPQAGIIDIKQAANYIISVEDVSSSRSATYDVSAAGGTFTLPSPSASYKYTFASGASATSWSSAWSSYYTTSAAYTWYEELPSGSPVALTDADAGTIRVNSRGTTSGTQVTHDGYVGCEVTYTITPVSTATFASEVHSTARYSYFIWQAANTLTTTYTTPTVSLSVSDIPAKGGSMDSGQVTYSQTRTDTYSSGSKTTATITSGGTVTYGTAVSADSLGTTIKARSSVGTLTVSVTLNGKTGSGSVTVYQAANTASWSDITMSGDYSSGHDIPAKGGTRATIPTFAGTQSVTYSSGEGRRTYIYAGGASTAKYEYLTSSGAWNQTQSAVGCPVLDCTWSTAVTAASLGTTVKSRSSVGTLTVTATSTSSGATNTKSWTVYQAANAIITYGHILLTDYQTAAQREIVLSYESGAKYTVTSNISMSRTYSSGSTDTITSASGTDFTRTLAKEGTSDLLTISGYTLSAASANPAVKQRLLGGAKYTVTHAASGKSTSATLTVYQNGAQSAIEVSPTSVTIPAAGGSSSVTVTANDTWTASVS